MDSNRAHFYQTKYLQLNKLNQRTDFYKNHGQASTLRNLGIKYDEMKISTSKKIT